MSKVGVIGSGLEGDALFNVDKYICIYVYEYIERHLSKISTMDVTGSVLEGIYI
jgi:hypothetical protein